MTAGIRIDMKRLEDALRQTHGNYQLSAKMLSCTREAIWKRVQKSERLQEIVRDEREGVVDVAEGALQRAVLNGEAWAVQFTLRNLGRDRGYFEKSQQEITGKDGGPVEVRTMTDEEVEKKAREILERRK
jgi:hypothetical protein